MPTPSRAHRWTLTRRITDRLFPRFVPGRHHSLENSLLALMVARESRP